MRVTIIGAGIGGLAAAVALRRIGIETLVVERVASIREVGAGLSLWSNAVIALRELGLEAEVIASASLIERSVAQTPAGRPITEHDFGPLTRAAGAPCICIHRPVLQKILLDALPPNSVVTGARCVGFDDSTAILESGEQVKSDVLMRQYERIRISRAASVVRDSWRTGKVLQLDSPVLESLRNWFMNTRLGERLGMQTFRTLLTHQLPHLRSPE